MAEETLNPLHALTGQNAFCANRKQKRSCKAQEKRSGVTLNMAVTIIHWQTIFCVLMNVKMFANAIRELEIAKLEGDRIE